VRRGGSFCKRKKRGEGVRGNAESPKSLYRIVIKQLRSYFALLGKYAVSLFSTRCDYEERWREACQEMRRNGETGAGNFPRVSAYFPRTFRVLLSSLYPLLL
jgi:hypothetical protein